MMVSVVDRGRHGHGVPRPLNPVSNPMMPSRPQIRSASCGFSCSGRRPPWSSRFSRCTWPGTVRAGFAPVVSAGAIGLTFASALRVLTDAQLSRAARNAAVVCLGVVTAVQWRVSDPLLFTGLDEQLHLRTLRDILLSHSLFQPHPQLAVSSRYPGLEAVTVLFHQLGLPVMVAAVAVVLAARLALVLALCDAVEHLTGSPRAGGLAVAAYCRVGPVHLFQLAVRVSDAGVTAGAGRGRIHCPRPLGSIIRVRYSSAPPFVCLPSP